MRTHILQQIVLDVVQSVLYWPDCTLPDYVYVLGLKRVAYYGTDMPYPNRNRLPEVFIRSS